MAYGFLEIATTPGVRAAQEAMGSDHVWRDFKGDRAFDRIGPAEAGFIAERDSFYMATVSETGWPYIQHRGGPAGFLRVLDERTLGFADFRGNRQYISLGNLSGNDKVALILMDYRSRSRMKIYSTIEVRDLEADPGLAAQLATPGYRGRAERGFLVHLRHFDWNCPQHITPRFTEAELAGLLSPMRERLEALEAENAALRSRLDAGGEE